MFSNLYLLSVHKNPVDFGMRSLAFGERLVKFSLSYEFILESPFVDEKVLMSL